MIRSNGDCIRFSECSTRNHNECIDDTSQECRISSNIECNMGVDCYPIGNSYCSKSITFDCGNMIVEKFCRDT